MSPRVKGRAIFVLVIGLLSVSCSHTPAPGSQATLPTSANGKRQSRHAAPESIAQRWLNALRNRDQGTLVALTALPFHFRTTAATSHCGETAASVVELKELAACIIADPLLAQELGYAGELQASRLPRDQVPTWADRIVSESNPEWTPVKLFINGDGVTYVFLLLVMDDLVEACIEHAAFEQG